MDRYILEALARCPLFHGMEADDIGQMMELVDYRVMTFSRDDVFILAGMPCKYADIIIRGELAARMVGLSGKYVEVSRLQSGNIVAPAFIFAKDRSMPVTVETETDVEILRMVPQELTRLMDMDDRVRTNFITTLSNINVFLTHKMRMLSLLTVREKVAFFLLDTATKQKSETIHLDKSRQEIADTFGIQKFSLMRCLSEFAEAGAIAVDGKDITILDRRKMK
jgi:CRP-like cAMP-binding protein